MSFCQNSENNSDKGLLWEISGNGLTEKSYLFGTWHGTSGVCIDFLDSISNFYKCFNSVTQYVGECTADASVIIEALMPSFGEKLMPQNIRYVDLLNEADIHFLDSILLKYINTKSSDVDITPNYLGYILSSIIVQKPYLETEDEKCKIMIDKYLLSEAGKKNCVIKGLDTPEILERISKEIYLKNNKSGSTLKENAVHMIRELKAALSMDENPNLKIITKNMEDAYRSMDLKNLVYYKNESIKIIKTYESPTFNSNTSYYFLTIGRNKIWMEEIPILINENPTFIAVGAIHLYGKDGLINLLNEKGYNVISVK
jgi:uncharacterized protein YbaP (TraB family)